MVIPIIVLAIVFVLTAVRQIGRLRLQIWQIMLFGAAAVLVTGQISPTAALEAINVDVMLFLFGMFVVGGALEESGYLWCVVCKFFSRAKSLDQLLLLILFVMGLSSAFLLNDTIAIIGTPIVLLLAADNRLSPKPLLLALAFAVTIGSAMSPIGNPQNLLIALNCSLENPFVTFFKFLFIPTILNLFLAYVLLKLFYKRQFCGSFSYTERPVTDSKLAFLSKISLILVLVLVAAKIVVVFLGVDVDFRLTYISLIAALPLLVFSPKRFVLLKKMDWHTLLFFASMFILMASVWDTGFFQSVMSSFNMDFTSLPVIMSVSVLLSQLISNVPLVALYLPMLLPAGVATKELMALAAGSTIAGNFSILGAASTVIILQNAEKKTGESFSFYEFVKLGVPLTILNVVVYWIFLIII